MSAATITVIDRATVELIRAEHEAAELAGREWVEHAIECGRLLLGVKAQLRHGEWGPWLTEHFPSSDRTARTYMQVAGAPEENRQRVADLPSLRQMRDALAEPRDMSPARTSEQLRQLGGGERSPEVQRRLEEARARHETESLWGESEGRKLARAREQLEGALCRLDDARNTSSLDRRSVGEIVRAQAVECRRAASLLDDLAFQFER